MTQEEEERELRAKKWKNFTKTIWLHWKKQNKYNGYTRSRREGEEIFFKKSIKKDNWWTLANVADRDKIT